MSYLKTCISNENNNIHININNFIGKDLFDDDIISDYLNINSHQK